MKNAGRIAVLGNVVLTARRKHVDDQRLLQRRRSVFNAAADYERIAGTHFKCLAFARDLQMSTYHVNHLLMRVAMNGSNPSFLHAMLGQKKLVVVSQDFARETRLRG